MEADPGAVPVDPLPVPVIANPAQGMPPASSGARVEEPSPWTSGREEDIPARMRWVEAALDAAGDRIDPQLTDRARTAVERAGQRMRLGADLTVVALVGATGSGKSSLFNALAGMEISQVAARRPTTSEPMACVWGADVADPLLDWLGVPHRNRTRRDSVLDADREAELAGLVLLDLPDHDSAFVAHRLEVDRLIDLVDLLIWVVDPQKYADEALHSGYLKTLTGHDDVMLVVLNQVDRLDEQAALTCRQDLRRLLDADGLGGVPVLTTSARRGFGVEELRGDIAAAVASHSGAIERATADLFSAVRELRAGVGSGEPDPAALPAGDEVVEALSDAAGLPVMLEAVAADYRRRALRRLDWPFLRWWRWVRPDPLLRIELGGTEQELRRLSTATLPAPTPSQKARVDTVLGTTADRLGTGLPPRWSEAVRRAATSSGEDLSVPLDAAVASVDVRLRPPLWWRVLEVTQFLVAVFTVFGFGWLAGLGVIDWVRVTPSSTPAFGPVPLPTALFLGGLVLGIVLAVVARTMVTAGARKWTEDVAARIQTAVGDLAVRRVLSPVAQVLHDHRAVRRALDSAG
ncbi:MAG: 50S ribosome-binding GTPase [Kineosporiaceae bacterium]